VIPAVRPFQGTTFRRFGAPQPRAPLPLSTLEQLPPEVLANIIAEIPIGKREALAAASVSLAEIVGAETQRSVGLEMQRRVRRAVAEQARPVKQCSLYANCLVEILGSIAFNDVDTMADALALGIVDATQPIYLLPLYGQATNQVRAERVSAIQGYRLTEGVDAVTKGLYTKNDSIPALARTSLSMDTVHGTDSVSWVNIAASLVAPDCLRYLLEGGVHPLPDGPDSALRAAIGDSLPLATRAYFYKTVYTREGPDGSLDTIFVPDSGRDELARDIEGGALSIITSTGGQDSLFLRTVRVILDAFPNYRPRDQTFGNTLIDAVYEATIASARRTLTLSPTPQKRQNALAVISVGVQVSRLLFGRGYAFSGADLAYRQAMARYGQSFSDKETEIIVRTRDAFARLAQQAFAHNVVESDIPFERGVRPGALILHPPPSGAQVPKEPPAFTAEIVSALNNTRYPELRDAIEAVGRITSALASGALDPNIYLPNLDYVPVVVSEEGIRSNMYVWRTMPWGLTRPLVRSPLGFVAYVHYKDPHSPVPDTRLLDAALRALTRWRTGAWPTAEAVVNTALVAMRPDGTPLETFVIVRSLLGTLRRSERLDGQDVNPLTVVRNALWTAYGVLARSANDQAAVAQLMAQIAQAFVSALMGAGYTPQERMASIPHPAVNSGLGLLLSGGEPDLESDFPRGVALSELQTMAKETEIDGLWSDHDTHYRLGRNHSLGQGIDAVLDVFFVAYGVSRAGTARLRLPPLTE